MGERSPMVARRSVGGRWTTTSCAVHACTAGKRLCMYKCWLQLVDEHHGDQWDMTQVGKFEAAPGLFDEPCKTKRSF